MKYEKTRVAATSELTVAPVVGMLFIVTRPPETIGPRTFLVRAGTTSIGRNAASDVHVAVNHISEQHAQLKASLDDAFHLRVDLEDVGSTNGTILIGTQGGGRTRLKPNLAQPINDGDEFSLGGHVSLRFSSPFRFPRAT